MRIALAFALLFVPSLAGAASINHDQALGCAELGQHYRFDRLLRAGYKTVAVDAIEDSVRARRCAFLPVGLRVRIEDTAGPYVCVVKLRPKSSCLWVHAQEVDMGN